MASSSKLRIPSNLHKYLFLSRRLLFSLVAYCTPESHWSPSDQYVRPHIATAPRTSPTFRRMGCFEHHIWCRHLKDDLFVDTEREIERCFVLPDSYVVYIHNGIFVKPYYIIDDVLKEYKKSMHICSHKTATQDSSTGSRSFPFLYHPVKEYSSRVGGLSCVQYTIPYLSQCA